MDKTRNFNERIRATNQLDVRVLIPSIDGATREAIRRGAITYSEIARDAIARAAVDRFLTEKELAQRWGASVKLVQKMRYAGGGPKITKIGSLVRYSLLDLLAFEAKHKFATTTEETAESTASRDVPAQGEVSDVPPLD